MPAAEAGLALISQVAAVGPVVVRQERISALDPKQHGVGGLIHGDIKWREQDKEAEAHDYYVVVFFPKINLSFKATLKGWHFVDTLSCSREAAVMKFLDNKPEGETWATYETAGWRVRKVHVTDLGDA